MFSRYAGTVAALSSLLVTACSTTPITSPSAEITKPTPTTFSRARPISPTNLSYFALNDSSKAHEIVMYSFGLLDVGYKFGGSNPDAGLDCSGMVAYVVQQVAGAKLPHNAAKIADITRPIERTQLRPGDLVFFNTLKRPYSHMGIYIGDSKFVHAPRTNSKVKVERLDSPYFAARFDGARTLFID